MTKQTLNISKKQIAEFLAKTNLFSELSVDSIEEIANEFELIYLAGNKPLIKQGEHSDSMYVLMYGFLRAIQQDANKDEKIIGEISSGSVVGEIGCLFDEPRTTSVYTIRDSVLLKMTRKTFNDLLIKHPEIMMGIARQSVKRLVNPKKYSPKRDTSCFTLIPAGNFTQIYEFSQKFVEKLQKYGNALLITYDAFLNLSGEKSSLESSDTLSIFQELENKYRFLVYLATENDIWADRCIRQADKILLIGKYGQSSELGEIERLVFNNRNKMSPSVELVLLAEDKVKNPVGVNAWFKNRDLKEHYKVRISQEPDLERLVRLITGNALGLILSGGGALALAHVGVLKALHEANILIDYIGGASMGSIISGLYALEIDTDTIKEMLVQQLTEFQSKLDYTFPIIALIRAKNLDDLLSSSFGKNTRIENLWQKYFCVSTNITTNGLQIHENGILWKAIRASLSLPGILPATFNNQKQVLVDGGILNNLPVDVLASRINGGKILASSIQNREEPPTTINYEEYTSSGWHLLFKYFLLPKLNGNLYNKRSKFMNIASIIQNSMIIGSNNHQQAMIQKADFNISMDLKNFSMMNFLDTEKIINSGYEQAITTLKTINLSSYKISHDPLGLLTIGCKIPKN